MNKLIIYGIGLLLLSSCTKDFDDQNSDPNVLTEVGAREMPFMFAKAQSSGAMDRSFYQTVQNLGADLYAQYFSLTSTSFQTDRYVFNPDWQTRFYTVVYVNTAPQLKFIIDNAEPGSGEQALANIWWVYTFHRLTDHFGPIPYFNALESVQSVAYDGQDVIYDDFFKRLTQAVADLKALGSGTRIFQGYELMYDGNVDYWIRFANTLRLRLALRISKVDPTRAKSEAEAAVQSGILTDNEQNASLTKALVGNDTNGLSQVAAWNEFAMSSTIASYLKGYEDPRMGLFFQPDVTNKQYNSLRNGLSATALGNSRNTSAQNSNVGTGWVTWDENAASWTPVLERRHPVMNAAEAWFLRAEGALNGWNMGGTAQELYEEGIRKSLGQWGVDASTIDAYMMSALIPVAPGDANNSPAVSSTPVHWSADESVEREQIGTQKWLAIFPDGMEAWAEFRRTGYPIMYPVVQSDNSSIPSGSFVKRLPYPVSEGIANKEALEKGRQLLGGADNGATSLWWDVD
ncbi:SusD/RagB family nutrient-binding outer membrane lipoprotein [Olivibacter sp. CPCC 100613]|uniref:SusD/RagB family nutrient-binding outer membrane lipoprotein n=1 Tax=Olivibacter sp. CPCC 100613 TaxID=3079931 RepID=UPI002FFCB95E